MPARTSARRKHTNIVTTTTLIRTYHHVYKVRAGGTVQGKVTRCIDDEAAGFGNCWMTTAGKNADACTSCNRKQYRSASSVIAKQLVLLSFRHQELGDFGVVLGFLARGVMAQPLYVQLLELHCSALRSFVTVVSDKAVNRNVRAVVRIEEIVPERGAGGNAFGRRVSEHFSKE
jgi:hypothetical protein